MFGECLQTFFSLESTNITQLFITWFCLFINGIIYRSSYLSLKEWQDSNLTQWGVKDPIFKTLGANTQ